jgi:hypothetical protein
VGAERDQPVQRFHQRRRPIGDRTLERRHLGYLERELASIDVRFATCRTSARAAAAFHDVLSASAGSLSLKRAAMRVKETTPLATGDR